MTLKVTSLIGDFAATITGANLKSSLADNVFTAIHEAVDSFGVVIFRDQHLDDPALIAFAKKFGPLEEPLQRDQFANIDKRITTLANVQEDGKVMPIDDKRAIFMKGNLLWHSDSSYKPVPSTYSILAALEVPVIGGETEFADARAGYDDWSGPFGETTKEELEDLVCEHSIIYSRSLISGDIFSNEEKCGFTAPHQPLVRTHPRNGRKIYYVGSHCSHVVDWPLDRGRALVRELTAFCVRPEHVYTHKWNAGDVAIWDNRSVLHRGRKYDPTARRIMHRATVAGDGPLKLS